MPEQPQALPRDDDLACALADSLDAALDREIRQRLRQRLPVPVTDVIQALVMVLATQLHEITSAGQYPPDKQMQCLDAIGRDLRAYFASLDEHTGNDTPLH